MGSRLFQALLISGGLALVGSSVASAQGLQFHTVLLGGNEVSGGGAGNAGDQDGNGASGLIIRGNRLTQLCIGTVVTNIDPPTDMHIHRGKAGVNGPVVVPLIPPAAGNPGHVSQCVNITGALSAEIRKNPNLFYQNVHTGQFPGGAIRGQLH